MLGEFDGLDNFDGDYQILIWIIFFLATFVSQVMIFNMLIAIMGDSYAKVQETRDEHALKANMEILFDYNNYIWDNSNQRSGFLVVIQEDNEDAGDEWKGVMAGIRSALTKTKLSLKQDFDSKINAVK